MCFTVCINQLFSKFVSSITLWLWINRFKTHDLKWIQFGSKEFHNYDRN